MQQPEGDTEADGELRVGRNGAGARSAAYIAVVQPAADAAGQRQCGGKRTSAGLHDVLPIETSCSRSRSQPISAARAWSMSFCSVSACFGSVIAPTMGSPTILPLRSTT